MPFIRRKFQARLTRCTAFDYVGDQVSGHYSGLEAYLASTGRECCIEQLGLRTLHVERQLSQQNLGTEACHGFVIINGSSETHDIKSLFSLLNKD